MINISNKANCCGCCACVDACKQKAINLKNDNEGFWYPHVDTNLCNNCGLCQKICPELNISKLKKNDSEKPIKTIAAIHKNMSIRWDSTSGGAFSAFAEYMYEHGGYVSGAIYNNDFTVKNFVSNDPNDLIKLRSSKYLQSKAEGIYEEIANLLKKDKKVLACGTPCQMAALRSFLKKDYENLIIIDFICRGVNSPKVFRKYLDSLENNFGGKIIYIKEKNKEYGWRSLTRKIIFDNNKTYYGIGMKDDFRLGYHTNVFCRPSCYTCKYKDFPRIADITIADYWGIENINKNLDNDIGTSMILLNSKKGYAYFELIKNKLEYIETDFNSIIKGNIALFKPIPKPTIDRNLFFEDLDKDLFNNVAKKHFHIENPNKNDNIILSTLKKIKGYYNLVCTFHKKYKNSIRSYYNFIWLNFIRQNTYAAFKKGNYIFTMPNSVFDIHPNAKIIINAPLIFGNNPIKNFHAPSILRMESNTSFEITPGPLTRYDHGPYNLRNGAYIEIVNEGKLKIGQGASNINLTIMCAKEITIGNGVRIGRNVSIRDWNGPHVIINSTYKTHAPVHIKDHVWLCSGCTIMPGVTIEEGAIIATNAVVTKDVPAKTLVAGIPAKVIKENIEWY